MRWFGPRHRILLYNLLHSFALTKEPSLCGELKRRKNQKRATHGKVFVENNIARTSEWRNCKRYVGVQRVCKNETKKNSDADREMRKKNCRKSNYRTSISLWSVIALYETEERKIKEKELRRKLKYVPEQAFGQKKGRINVQNFHYILYIMHTDNIFSVSRNRAIAQNMGMGSKA